MQARILIVDDDPALRTNIRYILEDYNYLVGDAANAEYALSASRGAQYDLALVDINLGDMPGPELVRKITEISPDTEFIYITGYASLDSAIDAVQQPRVVSYETKPLDFDRLLAFIKQIVERRQAEAKNRTYLRYLESMDRVNRVISYSGDLVETLQKIIDTVFSIFDCDCTYLVHPCNPQDSFWRPQVKAMREKHAGAFTADTVFPMTAGFSKAIQDSLETEGPLCYPDPDRHVQALEKFPACSDICGLGDLACSGDCSGDINGRELKSSVMYMALRPGSGAPWYFAVHHCSPPREWSKEERLLFRDIGRRLTDILTSLLLFRNLAEERALLTRRVEEHTAELSEANAELARAARLKDEFLANMSHELRTPLNNILGLSEALQARVYGTLNQQQAQSLQSIETSGLHLLTLINDILDISKIEAGKLDLDIQEVSIRQLCQTSLIFVKQQAIKGGLQIVTDFDGAADMSQAAGMIQADPRRLKQVLINLLSNAVKFTPKGGKVGLDVTCNTEQETVYLSVWDTGIGIPEAEMPRLFQPFVQAESGLSRRFEGTGLGLALVRRLVKLHGGCVSVESEPGKGSRFTVSLPWREAVIPSDIADKKKASKAPASPLILLVEDIETNAKLISKYLEFSGYRVAIARNGLEAVQQARETNPSLIIMDIQMQDLDAVEAAQHIRADTGTATTPIIALASLALPGDRQRCLDAGMNEHLNKPISLKRLIKVIGTMVNG
ncbi:MAG: response regulator [Gammaproteobacteria bacterium]|nr:response regulator [Gammaproteobacteria bacterium]